MLGLFPIKAPLLRFVASRYYIYAMPIDERDEILSLLYYWSAASSLHLMSN